MNISIAIADLNKDYIYRLTEVLQQNRELSISAFTSFEKLQEALERTRFDVLLFDPDISPVRMNLSGVKLALCLYSEECENTELYGDCAEILKYQRVSNIYKYILNEYADKAGLSLEPGSHTSTKLIGVYAPAGGSGKTMVSLALTCKLKLLGYSALFLSTEQFESSSAVNGQEEDGVTALIEAVSNDKVNFKVKLTAVSRHGLDDIDYLKGFEKLVDYEAVTEEEITGVLRSIKADSDYQYVVIDMESNLDTINKAVFDAVDQILLIEKPGEISGHKMDVFLKQVFVQERENKMLLLHNFAENGSSYRKKGNIPLIGEIHHYGNLNFKNIIHAVNSNGEYEIERLLNQA